MDLLCRYWRRFEPGVKTVVGVAFSHRQRSRLGQTMAARANKHITTIAMTTEPTKTLTQTTVDIPLLAGSAVGSGGRGFLKAIAPPCVCGSLRDRIASWRFTTGSGENGGCGGHGIRSERSTSARRPARKWHEVGLGQPAQRRS